MVDDVEIARLYDEVYERPADDGVRLVLADALVMRGDPRGELIQLHFRPRAIRRARCSSSSSTA